MFCRDVQFYLYTCSLGLILILGISCFSHLTSKVPYENVNLVKVGMQ